MEQHFILTDQEFEEQFAKSTLDPTIFTHEAHIRLAWLHIVKYGESRAIENITKQLYDFVTILGATAKYNETLTVSSIKAVNHFIAKKHIDNFYDFINAYPRLKYNFKEIIGQHYGFDIFNSIEAKKQYVAPDVMEFS